jgi:hypothetical protein
MNGGSQQLAHCLTYIINQFIAVTGWLTSAAHE